VNPHIVCDSYTTQNHRAVRAWPAKKRADHNAPHPDLRVVAEVEIFFGIITRQAIRRGTFTCVKDRIDGWNEHCQTIHPDQDRRPDPRKGDPRSIDHRSRDTRTPERTRWTWAK
jgi:hypothetical protein